MRYTIKKGRHSSGCRFSPYWRRDDFYAIAQFTPSCRYDLPGADQADTNKLYGLSFGLHTRWSARWGWKSRGKGSDTIMLVPYMHEYGEIVRPEGRMDVPINTDVHLSIIRRDRRVIFTAAYNDGARRNFAEISHTMSGDPRHLGYNLWPYFGGNRTAPHDIDIYMRFVDEFS
jgi:hypothetical protein